MSCACRTVTRIKVLALGLTLLAAGLANPALAAISVYSIKGTYMAATSSTVAMLPYFDGGYCCAGGSYTDPISAYTSGSTTVTQIGSSSLYFGDFSTHLPGGEISMNGVDSVDVAFAAPKKRPSSCSERRCVRSICKAPPATRTPS